MEGTIEDMSTELTDWYEAAETAYRQGNLDKARSIMARVYEKALVIQHYQNNRPDRPEDI